MKANNATWKPRLDPHLPPELAREIDVFESEINLRKTGKLDEKLFAETRLRRGVYGQRYDNGQRHDGRALQTLAYADKPSKGVSTVWDAPGMQRIKFPGGGMNAAQLETLADLAEEYSDGIGHVTTRQDFQLHYVHIEDTPALMRRLAAVGITTREACGNGVRNITACPYAGVCADESFDVTPYAQALFSFLLGHPDCQEFGRKFKPAFSGCGQHACGLVKLHDLGFVARQRQVNGEAQRGFEVWVGGGLGAVPYQARLYGEFVPVEEILPLSQAIGRVFARLGEKKNRNRARFKFLVQDLGIEKFRELVQAERAQLTPDPRWTDFVTPAAAFTESPLRPAGALPAAGGPEFREWLRTNVRPQKLPGHFTVTIKLPLGDITARQLRALADLARRFTRETVRTTVEQNLVLRWVSGADLSELYAALIAAHLAEAGAGGLGDIVSCPGTDTCKLGISASRGLARELRSRLQPGLAAQPAELRQLHLKISGCFNSCGQHHISDLGFYGVSRKSGGYAVPHFQLVLGGEWEHNAGAYGAAVMALPSKHVPAAVERLTARYHAERQPEENFAAFTRRLGRAELKKMLDDLARPPAGDFSDWGDPREYSLEDMGTGECAGEMVSAVEFELAAAEREAFEAHLALEGGDAAGAARGAYLAMVRAAKALVRRELGQLPDDPERIVSEFRARFYDTRRFFDPFAGGKFAQYLFEAHARAGAASGPEAARLQLNEAELFIDAAHSCYTRISAPAAAAGVA